MKVSFRIKNNKMPQLIKALDRDHNTVLEWGLFKDSGTHPKANMPLANLMAIHEYRDGAARRPLFHIQAARIRDGHLRRPIIAEVTKYLLSAVNGRHKPLSYHLSNYGSIVVKDAKSMFGKKGITYKGMHIANNGRLWESIKGHNRPLYHTGTLKKAVKFTTYRKGR